VQHLIKTLFGNNRNLEIIVSLGIAITPWIGVFGVTIWKDVPYTSLQLLSLSTLIRYLEQPHKSLFTKSVFFGSLSILFRHNGWPTIFLFMLFILVFFRRKLLLTKKTGAMGLLIFTVFFLVQVTLPSLVHDSSNPNWFKSIPIIADVSYAIQKDPSNPMHLKQDLASFAGPISRSGALNCASINGFVFSPDFNSDRAGELNRYFLSTWLSYLTSNPSLILEPHLCRVNNFLPPLIASSPNYYYWLQTGVVQNPFGISSQAPEGLQRITSTWTDIWDRNGVLITNPGMWWLISGLVLFFSKRRTQLKYLEVQAKLTFLWCTSSSLVLILAAVAQDVRYAYPYLIPAMLITVKALSKSQ
jgi:hypothetical protein